MSEAAATVPRVFGRPVLKNPQHPIHTALMAVPPDGMSDRKLAAHLGVKHQQLSQWINGQQWIPLAQVRKVEELTRGAVKLGHWAKVRDRETGQYWQNGQASNGPWK